MLQPVEIKPGPVPMPKHLSPSAIFLYEQCPYKYRLAKVEKIKEPTSEHLILGSFVHSIAEAIYGLPAEERTIENARKLATDIFGGFHDPSLTFGKDIQELISGKSLNDWRWKAWHCVENLFAMEDPTQTHPTVLEEFVRGVIDGVTVLGFMDRFDKESDVGPKIIDYKTGKVPKEKYSGNSKLQLMIYVLLVEQIQKIKIEQASLYYLSAGKEVSYTPTEELRAEAKAKINSVWEEIKESSKTGIFETRTGPLCDWCYFQPICPAFS